MMSRALYRSFFLVCLAFAAVGGTSIDDGEMYALPLVNGYFILRQDYIASNNERPVFSLVESDSSPGGGYSSTELVPAVETVAVAGNAIFGKAKHGYYVLNASTHHSQPQKELSAEQFNKMLTDAGIAPSTPLVFPDVLAAKLSEFAIRPWNFRVMGGRFGLSDGLWSLTIQIAGLAVAFLIGLAFDRSIVVIGVAIGVFVNIVGQMLIAGEGPALLPGFVLFPIIYIGVGKLGGLIRRGTKRLIPKTLPT